MPRTTRVQMNEATVTGLLQAGKDILDRPGTTIAHLKAADIARLCGRTTGAYYHHWPTDAAYQQALFGQLVLDFESLLKRTSLDGLVATCESARIMKFVVSVGATQPAADQVRAFVARLGATDATTRFWGRLLLQHVTY